MEHFTIQADRIQHLNQKEIREGEYVIYWMQQSQRSRFNHALEYAVAAANNLDKPLLVVFGVMNGYPEANLRHYTFMMEGLKETQASLADRGIRMVVQHGNPDAVAVEASRKASLLVCDRGYLRHQAAWRRDVARHAPCRVVQVEADAVVPVDTASGKAEYAARTIRPKLMRLLDRCIADLPETPLRRPSLSLDTRGIALDDISRALDPLPLDRAVGAVSRFYRGGTTEAERLFLDFSESRLRHYVKNRNQPQTDDVSHMSMYLHFGQISPVYLAWKLTGADPELNEQKAAYLEELIVRRELAMNFVHHNPDYDSFGCLPNWALETLRDHEKDPREHLYTRDQLENARTHDPYWNAAMLEMKHSGYMHNAMRMYWGKKILEWSETPEKAFRTALELNNRYFLDGRDPSSYAGVAWVFGLHDRPWKERPIFGKVRIMLASGLERKCDIQSYVEKAARLVRE